MRDDTIHLWNFRQKRPEIVHSIKLAKERVTCVYLPFQSKWLHVGTDKGNVYFVGLADFELSAYVINWNKAIDLYGFFFLNAIIMLVLKELPNTSGLS